MEGKAGRMKMGGPLTEKFQSSPAGAVSLGAKPGAGAGRFRKDLDLPAQIRRSA
jgi:hypothetical protein